jgi:hypothetical protein
VVVSWAWVAIGGTVSYQVRRGAVLVAETDGESTQDPDAPIGVPVRYEISTVRENVRSVPPIRTDEVFLTPEVVDPVLEALPDMVTGRWRPPQQAHRSRVRRHDSHSGSVELTDVGSDRFVDRDVIAGHRYRYRIRVEYLAPDGTTRISPGTFVAIDCPNAPVAVRDLRTELDGGDLVLSWTPPPHGEVGIHLVTGRAVVPTGIVPSAVGEREFGPTLIGIAASDGLRVPGTTVGAGRLVPVTRLGDLMVAGDEVAFELPAPSIGPVQVEVLGNDVNLRFVWPAEVNDIRVLWRPDVDPVGPHDPEASVRDISRTRYDRVGATVGLPEPGRYRFAICARLRDRFGPLTRTSATVRPTVRLEIRRVARGRPATITVTVHGSDPIPLISLRAKSRGRPRTVTDGVELHRFTTGGDRATTVVLPTELTTPVHLRAFSPDPTVSLIHPDARHLVIR